MNDGIGSGERLRNGPRVAKITQKKFKVRVRPNAQQGASAMGENIENADLVTRGQQLRD
jgi:hypothetical protein